MPRRLQLLIILQPTAEGDYCTSLLLFTSLHHGVIHMKNDLMITPIGVKIIDKRNPDTYISLTFFQLGQKKKNRR